MKIYLSGPISLNDTLPPGEIEKNLERFHIVAEKLRGYGYQVLSPAELPKDTGEWKDFMRLCIKMVCESDLVYLLPYWGYSRGSIFEALVANTIGVPVHEYREEEPMRSSV